MATEQAHPGQRRYPPELKERAVRMVQEIRREEGSNNGIIGRVAGQLGIGVESLRSWVKRADVDAGARPGVTSADAAEIARLRKENKELTRANEILKAAAVFFGAELDRRQSR